MRIRLILVWIVAAALGLLIIGCESGSKIELVGQQVESKAPLFGDYSIVVKCRFLNTGNATTVTAKAELTASNGSWTKRQTTNIASGQEREIIFEFPEAVSSLFGDNSYTYGCAWES